MPVSIPLDPPIDWATLEPALSAANIALGRLDGVAEFVPNPDLFVAMYVRKEAVLSSQIEGTQASLDDVLEYEAGVRDADAGRFRDVDEVFNYVGALNAGLARLSELPLSLRLLKEIHARLLSGVRGQERTPGEFRRTQNWIGGAGSTIATAAFVPPPPQELPDALGNLERYVQGEDATPVLVRCGVAHAQFETIHPFLDGNGRLGRLLITFMLCERKVLRRPLLYLSAHFKRHRSEYYEWLMRVRTEGDWEGWLRFFLAGVEEVARGATDTAHRVLRLQAGDRELVREHLPKRPTALTLLELLYVRPVVNSGMIERELSVAPATANGLLADFVRLGILREITGRSRGRVFRYQAYMEAMEPS